MATDTTKIVKKKTKKTQKKKTNLVAAPIVLRHKIKTVVKWIHSKTHVYDCVMCLFPPKFLRLNVSVQKENSRPQTSDNSCGSFGQIC